LKLHGLPSAVSLVLPIVIMSIVIVASAIVMSTPNLMYCSDGEIRVPIEYCSRGIYSREFGEFNISADSWTTIMVKTVEAPNNFADIALEYLRQKGFEVSVDDVYGFTMIMKPIRYRLIKTGVNTSVKLPNDTIIRAEVANIVKTVLIMRL